MKSLIKNIAILALGVGVVSTAHAATVCGNSGVACATPAAASQPTITLNSASILNIQCINSSGANGNDTTSNYYFAVSHTDLGSTVANNGINNSGNGLTVEGVFATHPTSATPGSTVTAGRVDGTKGGTSYFIYAQACPAGSADNSTNCSSWAKIDASAVNTAAYPTSVFNNPTKPGDATISSIKLRTNVPSGDISNVASIDHITVNDLITPANGEGVNNIGFSGNPGPYTIDNSLFTNGFKPNNKYTISAQVSYPWDDVPTSGPQTVPNAGGAYWTTPENPGAVSAPAATVTHCSAVITAHNSNVATPNPTYTEYSLCATGICATSARIGGTPLSSDPISVTINGLVPGTTYTPNAKALVGNQDGTETGWNSSGVTNGTNFTTSGTNGTFTISNLQPTTATFNFPAGFDTTGATSWQILITPAIANPPSGTGQPPAAINLTGLVPNTAYTIQIKVNEASCNYTVPITPLPFTTPAVPPTSFALATVDAFTLHATWLDGVNATSNYQVQYCTPDLTGTCQTVNTTTAGTLNINLTNLQPSTPYCAHALTLANAGGTNSAYSNSACATTPANKTGITIAPPSATINAGNNQVFTASVVDQNGNIVSNPQVNWSVTGGGSLSATPAPSVIFTATTPGGPFFLHGSITLLGTTYTNVSTITVVAGGPFFSSGPVVSVNPDNITGMASAQGNDAAVGATPISYNWTLVSGPAGAILKVVPNNSTSAGNASITYNKAGTYTIACTITDNFGSKTTNAAPVTVNQVLSTLKVCEMGDASCANTVTVMTLQNAQFNAVGGDQFGGVMAGTAFKSVTWTGASSSNGAQASYSASMIGTNVKISATGIDQSNNSRSGFIIVNVVSFDVSGAKAYPVPYKANSGTGVIHFVGMGNQWTLHIYTTSGRRVFDIAGSTDMFDWTIKNSSGESIASGVYFYVIESPQGKKNGKLIIIQ